MLRSLLGYLLIIGVLFVVDLVLDFDYESLWVPAEIRNKVTPLGKIGQIEVETSGRGDRKQCILRVHAPLTGSRDSGSAFLLIQARPGARLRDDRFWAGATANERLAPNRRPVLTVSDIDFHLIPSGNWANIRDDGAIGALVAALEQGETAAMRGWFADGSGFTATFPVAGLAAARQLAEAECGAFPLSPAPAAGPADGPPRGPPVAIGRFGDFTAYTAGSGARRTCYLEAAPRLPTALRPTARLVVANKPAQGVDGEILFDLGHDFQPPPKVVEASLSERAYALGVDGALAWADPVAEREIRKTLQKERPLSARIRQGSGGEENDIYWSNGYPQGKAAIDEACR